MATKTVGCNKPWQQLCHLSSSHIIMQSASMQSHIDDMHTGLYDINLWYIYVRNNYSSLDISSKENDEWICPFQKV